MKVLEAGLDAAAQRQRVIAHNIANFNTPNFKSSRVSFEEELKAWLKGENNRLAATHPAHLGGGNTFPQPDVVKTGTPPMRPDGNNVDLDSEQIILAANLIKFQAMSRHIDDKFSQMRHVVTDGRR